MKHKHLYYINALYYCYVLFTLYYQPPPSEILSIPLVCGCISVYHVLAW
jgi:hypothetical protein